MRWKDKPHGVLIALLMIHVVAHIDRNMLLGFSPQITHDLGLSNAQYGLLTGAVWVLSYGFMALFMGSLADRFSRTRVMAAGILIWSVCTAASGAAQSFEQMVAARFLVASGEAALVPAAVSLVIELFQARRPASAVGVFFMGIPLGIGLSFLLAGTVGATQGWRGTFYLLGVVGVAIGVPLLFLKDRRDAQGETERGAPFLRQVKIMIETLRETPTVMYTIAGFVLVHMVFAGLSFAQLWLVRERGFDAAAIARQMGGLQIVFGMLGAVVGGVLSDRVARRMKGGHAGFVVLLIALCGPLMLAYRFAPAGSALFYLGMCAGFFLPLATYGPSLALIQGLTPDKIRSTVTGFTMLLLNIFAIALGNLAVGAVSDHLSAAGSIHALTAVLLVTDVLAISAAAFFVLAARGTKLQAAPAGMIPAH
ncbi:MFS transporter [Variovorax sp. YR216]|uniref:MFS transporter n=1 Tax=Variovorax sp. YR216 TaxID=1882828 RepID=UPI00089B86B1|nr:MFS transporter [Variovorax sp. YR216]SEB19180.1 Sugar phosphate permease [Variovorax sp. YR216]